MKLSSPSELSQQPQLSQRQIQSLKLLELDNCALNKFLQNEYIENPLLDYTPSETAPFLDSSMPDSDSYSEESTPEMVSSPDPASEAAPIWDAKGRRQITAPDKNELLRSVLDQLDSRRYSARELEAIRYMTGCLDENGYFTATMKECSDALHLPVDIIRKCYYTLRSLEPCGIFSPDLPSCLIWQLRARGEEDPNIYLIVEHYLPDIAQGHVSTVSRALHLSTADVRRYIRTIQELNPRPLQGASASETEYIVPDLIIVREKENWTITVNDHWMGTYSLNSYYMKMLSEAKDPELRSYFQAKLARGNFIISSIEQRRKTLTDITRAILARQEGFFLRHEPLKPMTLNDIAADLSVHTSTVSRGIRNKYLQYPGGMILVRGLFHVAAVRRKAPQTHPAEVSRAAAALKSAAREEHAAMLAASRDNSADAVKRLIRNLIAAEKPEDPYTDSRLTALFQKNGINISRRTVAKYRESMGIKGVFDRTNGIS